MDPMLNGASVAFFGVRIPLFFPSSIHAGVISSRELAVHTTWGSMDMRNAGLRPIGREGPAPVGVGVPTGTLTR